MVLSSYGMHWVYRDVSSTLSETTKQRIGIPVWAQGDIRLGPRGAATPASHSMEIYWSVCSAAAAAVAMYFE
jgi:hypothetical protein